MFEFLKRLRKSDPKELGQLSQELLANKYNHFRALLSANNKSLEIIADMEDKMSGEYLFDKTYLLTNTSNLSESIQRIIENLNKLSDGAFQELFTRHSLIKEEITKILEGKFIIPVSPFTIPLEDLTSESLGIAGGKLSHLGEIKTRLLCPVPEGFTITSYAFKRFMEHNNIGEKIHKQLSSLKLDNMESLQQVSNEIQGMIRLAEVPREIYKAITEALTDIKSRINARDYHSDTKIEGLKEDIMFSVRSSAVFEDGDFSFAGQYATFLNVRQPYIIEKYKAVLASLFTPNAVFYHKTKGFSETDMVMAVGVLEMVNARAGGVIYTRDPNNPEKDWLLINAVHGLGKAVVDGTHGANSYIYSRESSRVIESRRSSQQTMLLCAFGGEVQEVALPEQLKDRDCLTQEEIDRLVAYAIKLEDYYRQPQDIEWAIDNNNNIFILQTRQLRINQYSQPDTQVPRYIEGYNLLIDKGVIACRGIGYGKAYVVSGDDDISDFPEGAVLVARHTSTRFAMLMHKASAIVADIGGTTGHMASIAREYNVPTIVDTEKATKIIKQGQEITVDAYNCNVYEGKVQELIGAASRQMDSSFKKTQIFKTLQDILRWISPLNLTDPSADDFNAQSCKTFHDITRFAHETSMRLMFEMGLNYEEGDSGAATLRAGIPTEVLLLDLGGGIAHRKTIVNPDEVLSIPFKVFLAGMLKMRWPEPPRADAKGFLGMIARTATISEDQIAEAGRKSFAIVSDNYMNFSIRLGYHFSLVESFIGDNINDNYIKFFFKGGGAAIDRRLRRVGLITKILRKMDFHVVLTNDVINAIVTDFKREYMEEKLEIMGKLTAYTKQLDMTLYNDNIAAMFTEQFVKDHMRHYL